MIKPKKSCIKIKVKRIKNEGKDTRKKGKVVKKETEVWGIPLFIRSQSYLSTNL